MKEHLRFVPAVAVFIFINLLSATETVAGVNKAVVRAIRGDVTYASGQSDWRRARVGNAFRPGTTLRTGHKATIDLFLDENGPVIRLTPETELTVERLDIDRSVPNPVITTQLSLHKGRVLARVHTLRPGSRYELITPKAVISVRGTEFSATAEGDVGVISGEVEIRVGDEVKRVEERMEYRAATRELRKIEHQDRLEFAKLHNPTGGILVCPGIEFQQPFAPDPQSPFARVHGRRPF